MKLTFKDLKQQKFVIEAEPTETVAQVKEKISQEKGWEASLQKLIYSGRHELSMRDVTPPPDEEIDIFSRLGKILQDANTVESYKIEEKGFIPKAPPAASSAATSSAKAPSTPAPAAASTPVAPAAPAPAPAPASNASSNLPATPSPAPATTAETPRSFNDPSALAMGEAGAAAVANMESMGFPRADIDRAMRAAFFNPDRAVEYLLSGIPETVEQDRRPPTAPTVASPTPATEPTPASTDPTADTSDAPINLFEAAAQAGRGTGTARPPRGTTTAATAGLAEGLAGAGAGAAAGAGGLGNLDFLRNNPQFQQLRQIVQTQPRMLEPILQQVGAGNPQLAQLIGQNPDQFLQLLSEDADEEAPMPPGLQAVSVTEEEREAIERLCRLGFERDLVIQAYFACDKNEELAANFLFDQPDEGDEA